MESRIKQLREKRGLIQEILGMNILIFYVYMKLADDLRLRRMAAVYEQQLELCERHQQERELSMLGNWFDEGGQLSGGQWQKIALARTYYKNADLYLLDEPSSALDVTAETKIFKSFFEVSKNKIAIYITHRVKIAQDANKIIVLDGGKIVGIGTHAELLKNCSVYQDLYNQENLKNKG